MGTVVDRTGWACEVKDVIHFAHVEGLANILLDKFESGFRAKMRKIREATSEKIVDYDDTPTFRQQSIRKMGSKKSSTTRNDGTSTGHAFLPFFNTPAGTSSGCDTGRPIL